MITVTLHSGQGLLDICIQEHGSVEALVQLAKDNGVPLDHIPEAGEMVKVDEQASFKPEVVQYFKDRGRLINTWSRERVGVKFVDVGFVASGFLSEKLIQR